MLTLTLAQLDRGGDVEEIRGVTGTDTVPVGRAGRPEDVAGAVLYLVSSASAFLTGTELVVDGGDSA